MSIEQFPEPLPLVKIYSLQVIEHTEVVTSRDYVNCPRCGEPIANAVIGFDTCDLCGAEFIVVE